MTRPGKFPDRAAGPLAPCSFQGAGLMRSRNALWKELEAWAQDELRSVNGQIEYLLKQAVGKRRGGAEPGAASRTKSGD